MDLRPEPYRTRWIWALFFFTCVSAAFGGAVRFRRISLDEGLSQSTVYCIYQDRLGFLWFGTYDGLNRYDGHGFKQFKLDPNDPTSISDNRILALFEDREGRLWVGTDGGGLNRYDPEREAFVRVQKGEDGTGLSHNRVRAMAQDAEGRLWIGTGGGGLNRMDPDGIKVYRRDSAVEGGLSHNRVRVLLIDSRNRLWIGTGGGGLDLYQPETDDFRNYRHLPDDPTSLSDNEINAIIEAADGRLWIGTYSGGLNRFDPETGLFESFRHRPDDYQSLAGNKVHALLEDDLGQIWIATDQGLDRYAGPAAGFVHYRNDPTDPTSLSDSMIQALYMDRSGVFWLGTRNNGINKLERGKQSFELFQNEPGNPRSLADNRVSALYQDLMGRLWIGTGGSGLNRYDPAAGSFYSYRHTNADPDSLSDNRVLSVEADKAGRLWVGTRAGLNSTPLEAGGTFQRYRASATDEDALANEVVWSLLADRDGRLWVGTEDGLDLLKSDGSGFVHHRHDPQRPDSLGDSVVWSLYQDSAGDLWVGTENGGLSRRTGPDTFFTHRHDPNRAESLSNNTVLSIYEDDGRLWVGTWGGGLNGHLGDDRFEHISERDGLPNDVIHGILGDGRGNLWLSTNRGLSQFNPGTGAFRNYATNDGLQGMEFNPGACFRGLKGEMFFGGNNGFNAFHPDNFRENTRPPEMLVTAFRAHEDLVGANIRDTASYTLSYRENYLSFSFVAFDYNEPDRNRFQYMLEGEDQEWITGTHGAARYNNLEPGHYTFRVKASNNDNVWNEEGVTVQVHIVPPFYRTRWFYGLCLLAVLGLFAAAGLFQRNLLKQEEAKALVALELKRKTEELEEARRLQLSMLPKSLPELPHLQLAVRMETASEVGGDYYDFHLAPDGVLTAAVGDATGHGLRAGTLVAAAKGLFLSLVAETEPPALLARASHVLRQMGFKKMFMALLLARFEGRRMKISVAGMPSTYIYRADTGEVEVVSLRGLPLGAVPFPYQEAAYDLEPGDVVLFNSDGLEEMFNRDDQMLGGAEVGRCFAHHAHLSPSAIIDALLALGRSWAGDTPQADDITLVVVKVT